VRAALLLLCALAGCAAPPPAPDPLEAGLRALRDLAERSRPDGDPGTIDLLVAPDAEFLRVHGARAVPVLEAAVATVDRVLGPECGFRFRVGGAVLFPSTPGIGDGRRLLFEARLRLDRGVCDVAAAFTGQRCGERAGAAEPDLRLLLCADAEDPERNLLHEAAHLFGATDYPRGHPGYALPSVMSYDGDLPRTLSFDLPNLRRIRARRGVLPSQRRDSLAEDLAARESGPRAAALVGGFLCAESRTGQAEGIAPARILLADAPSDPVALWIEGECLRVLRETASALPLLFHAIERVRAKAVPDAVDRHGALEIARLAVDDVDGMGALRAAAEPALARLPEDAVVLDLRASLRAREGDRAEAERLYRAAAAADPGAVYPWRHLAALGKTAADPALWLDGWRRALAADPLDPELGARWVEDGLDAYPQLIRSDDCIGAALAALAAAEAAFPKWGEPARLRYRLRR
jgi:hypothetical protein